MRRTNIVRVRKREKQQQIGIFLSTFFPETAVTKTVLHTHHHSYNNNKKNYVNNATLPTTTNTKLLLVIRKQKNKRALSRRNGTHTHAYPQTDLLACF